MRTLSWCVMHTYNITQALMHAIVVQVVGWVLTKVCLVFCYRVCCCCGILGERHLQEDRLQHGWQPGQHPVWSAGDDC